MTEENPKDEVQIEGQTEEQVVQEQIESKEEVKIEEAPVESKEEVQIESNQEMKINEAQMEMNQEEQANAAQFEGQFEGYGEEKKEEDMQKEQIVDKMEIGESGQKDKVEIFEANAIIGSTAEQRYAQLDENQLNRPTKTLGLLNELSNQLTQENQAAQMQAIQGENQGGYQGYPAGFMSGYHGYQGVNTMPGQGGATRSQNLDDSIDKKIQQLKLKLSGSRMNAPAYMPGTQSPEMQDMQGMPTKIQSQVQEGQNMMANPLGSYKRFNDLFSMINTEAQESRPRPQINTEYAPMTMSQYKPSQPKPYSGGLSPSSRFDIATPSTFSYKPKPMGYAAMVEKIASSSRNMGFGSSGTYSPKMYEIGKQSPFTTGNKDFMYSKTANPAYLKFAKNYGTSKQLNFITDQFAQKMKDDNTKANLNFLAENSGKRCLRSTGNYNRGFYKGSLSTFDTRLFPGGTNLRSRYKS